MTDYTSIFPLHIASRELIAARVLSGLSSHCSCFSAIWRQFLIIFPKHRETILMPQVWKKTLAEFREFWAKKIKGSPHRTSIMKTRKDYQKILTIIGQGFITTSGSFKSNELDKILGIISFFIDENSDEHFIFSIIHIVARLYYQFQLESVNNKDNSPYSILMDKYFIVHDICHCVQSLIKLLHPFFNHRTSNDVYQQICFLIKKETENNTCNNISPPLPDQIIPIMNIYSSLFLSVTNRNEINSVWSMIFSQFPDCTILHYFYTSAFILSGDPFVRSGKANTVEALPMAKIGIAIGKKVRMIGDDSIKKDLIKSSDRVDELIKLIKENDGIKNREIIRNQLTTMIQITRGTAHIEDLLPVHVISDILSEYAFK